jgi:hypothetical protein
MVTKLKWMISNSISTLGRTSKNKPIGVPSSVVSSNLESRSTSTVQKMKTLVEAAYLLGGSESSPTSLDEFPNQERRSKYREDSSGDLRIFPSESKHKSWTLR